MLFIGHNSEVEMLVGALGYRRCHRQRAEGVATDVESLRDSLFGVV